jgi:hypothetical protein
LAEGLSKFATKAASDLLENAQGLQEHWKKAISHRGVTLGDRQLGVVKRPHPTDPESVQVITLDDPLITPDDPLITPADPLSTPDDPPITPDDPATTLMIH